MNLGLAGRTALVAASTEGLGYATAAALAADGARVWIGSRGAEKVSAATRSLEAASPGAAVGGAVLDVGDPASIRAWIEGAAARFGPGIDALVVNSGGPPPGGFGAFDDAAWSAAFELLVLSAVRLIRGALPGLKANKGSILVCSSTSVREPIDGLILSNSLRSATVALAKSLSAELAPSGVRVNCLAPGRFATGRVDRLDEANAAKAGVSLDEARAKAKAAIPLGRYGDPAEFGAAAAWMVSPSASFLTGQVVTLDGGQVKATW